MTAFAQLSHAELTKEANFAKLVGRGLTWAGRGIGSRAADKGGKLALNAIRESGGIAAVGGRGAASRMLSAGRLSGRRNSLVGQGLRQVGATIGRSQGLQKAINYGSGAALAAGGLYGANRMGHASGYEAGANDGLDAGMTAGMESAMASQGQNQPGYLGGLWNALKGQQSGGVNPAVAFGDLSNRRGAMLNQLLMSRS